MRIASMLMTTAALLAMQMSTGCGSIVSLKPKGRAASLTEFAAAPSSSPGSAPTEGSAPPQSAAEEVAPEASAIASAADQPPTSFDSAPTRLRQPGDRVMLNSLIGQINGRPIFADEFFAPLEDQILAGRREIPPAQFRGELSQFISRHLTVLVDNELFIADAYASLTPEQKKGLVGLVTQFQEEFIGGAGGGVRSTTEQMLAEEGYTIDKLMTERQNVALIQKLRMDRIRPRVIVSWRDVEREYRRRHDEFNPQPILTIGRIRLSTADEADKVQEVRERLARGEDFKAIAASLGVPEDGVWLKVRSATGRPEDVPDLEPVKQWLTGLQVGQVSSEFQVGSLTYWLAFLEKDQAPSQPLHDADVQRSILAGLRKERENAEMERYAAQLRERWVADDLEAMRRRLITIADERYVR